ncbi:RagB/SusD family nutrient uptake outer membrane protein [Pedobacter gandavensis]|uniref:RagB/SusD family nutrient uptake outer membrane protein n=1 Tax=Pedobacter gandavensis TaxID=2679963 RepID=UPI00292F400D|nr:RagB/SusD family nutrient uptake outer membrane protein [Pedobacter gandavensis]
MKTNLTSSMNKYKLIYILFALCLIQFSCKKFLDYKPDKSLTIPSTLGDCQAILDYYSVMNGQGPNYAEAVSDNIYLLNATYKTLTVDLRDTYIWKANAEVNKGGWAGAYQTILYANQVLETLKKITPTQNEQITWNQLKGSALFFRAYTLFQAAQIWTKPYDPATANQDPGLPIKLTSDLNEKTERGTVELTYNRILQDLNEAIPLLPLTTALQSRPNSTAAYGMLARVYLAMGDYINAGTNADACLKQYSTLLDYNNLNANATYPIAKFNKEVIFESSSAGGADLIQLKSNAIVNSDLYLSYSQNDLRKTIFFVLNPADQSYSFKGSYDGANPANPFTGIATDEIYLIRAECFARAGRTEDALTDLNILLATRWIKTAPYPKYATTDASVALGYVLLERRKELIQRGLRWSDLRRLNKDPKFAITLSRTIDGQTYTLPPNDLRYVLLIPTDAIIRSGIAQNPR